MTSFAARLRMAMAFANISMRDLARSLGVSPMAISKWAQGKCHPRSSHLIGISERCGVSIEWLLEPGNPFTGQDRIDELRRELKETFNECEAAEARGAAKERERCAGIVVRSACPQAIAEGDWHSDCMAFAHDLVQAIREAKP